MATLFVDKVDPQSGTSLEIGSSGDTITIPSGATIVNSGTQTGFGGVNTPAFHARISSTISLARNTNVKITNLSEDFDTASAFASNTFTVPSGEGGKYCIYFALSCNTGVAGADGELIKGMVYKNGSYLNGFQSMIQDNGAASMNISNFTATFTGVATLNATDTLEFYANTADQNNSASVEANPHTIFGAYKIIE